MTSQATPELDRKGLEAAWEQAEGWCGQSGAIPDWFTNAILAYRRASEGASLATVGEEPAQEYYARGYGLRCRVTDYLNSTMSKNAFRAAFLEWEACSGTKFLPSPDSRRASEGASLATATHRHKKRGSEYTLLGFGKMQAENWRSKSWDDVWLSDKYDPVDMREVAIYRAVDDGSLWVRPREEFEDGRFEALRPVPGEAAGGEVPFDRYGGDCAPTDEGSPQDADYWLAAPPAPVGVLVRPDWPKVYDGIAHKPDRDGELLTITRETARLALSAINEQNGRDYYHNFGAAATELHSALATLPKPDFWAVHSRTGMHIGLWADRADADEALRGYEGGTITPLFKSSALAPAPSPDRDELLAAAFDGKFGKGLLPAAIRATREAGGQETELSIALSEWSDAITAALSHDSARGGEWSFREHLQRQRDWSSKTFGPGPRTKGVIDHIRKELCEIEADPTDISEWIDVTILALDGAWRAGYHPDEIIEALRAKQAKNEARNWPDWRTSDPDKAIEHVRAAPLPTTEEPRG